MATPSRTAQITRTIKVLRKHYKPVTPVKERSLLEHLLFACLLENSPHDAAEQVLASLQRNYFDWNEVRVSTIRELTEALKPLVNPAEAAIRLKQALQSVFESVYQFDIETLKKQNIGQAVKQLQKYNGTSPFGVAYVTQMALGGHAVPVSRGALIALHAVGVISDDEFAKSVVPGLERAVGKAKGAEVGSLLHQLGVEVVRNPYGPVVRKLLLEINPNCKDRLPKRPAARPQEDGAPPAHEEPPVPAPAAAPPARPAAKKPSAKPAPRPAAAQEKKTPPTRRPKATKKHVAAGKKPAKAAGKSSSRSSISKRKPR
jgi:endonuclease-3